MGREHRSDSQLHCSISVDGIVSISPQGGLLMLLYFLQFWAKSYQKDNCRKQLIDWQTHFSWLTLSSAGFSCALNNNSVPFLFCWETALVQRLGSCSLYIHSLTPMHACSVQGEPLWGWSRDSMLHLQNSIVWISRILPSFGFRSLQQILHRNWHALDFCADAESYNLGKERKFIAWLAGIWERKLNQLFGLFLSHR